MNFPYVSQYDSPDLRGIDNPLTPRPWDIIAEILACSGHEKKLLDIGCGTAFKLVPLSSHFNEMTGLDISHDMVKAAHHVLRKNNIHNVKLINGDSSKLNFEDHSYDMITCMLSRWDIKEIARVLKPTGNVIVEHVGCEDKKDFKLLFGAGVKGWRGQFLNEKRKEYLNHFYNMFNEHFDYVAIKNGFWQTYYTEQGILELLKFTPTIDDFDETADSEAIKMAFKLFKTTNGIVLTQNRLLIHAKNPRIF